LDAPALDPRLPPYPGLEPFDQRREAVFFGREQDVEVVLGRLRSLPRDVGDRVVVLMGASGAGKSSLLRAGVLPKLARVEGWAVTPAITPLDAPFDALERALGEPVRDADALVRIVAGLGDRVALSIDQGEQLATQTPDEERIEFLDLLAAALS